MFQMMQGCFQCIGFNEMVHSLGCCNFFHNDCFFCKLTHV